MKNLVTITIYLILFLALVFVGGCSECSKKSECCTQEKRCIITEVHPEKACVIPVFQDW